MLIFPVVAQCQNVDFDFESEAPGVFDSGVVFTSGDLDVVVTTPDFPLGFVHVFDTAVIPVPGDFGTRTISGFQNEIPIFGENLGLAYEFSKDIRSATILFGDGGGDDDGTATLELFDAGGNQVGVLTQFIGTSDEALSITVDQTFRSAILRTDGTAGPNSVVQEWIDVQAVPEPSVALVLIGLALVNVKRRRK